ncbi:MAG: hypothetical protein HY775_03750 [Acidobacteria bacterium]|nr:hypothetical protein [Acidobacteriota bacterium]
MEIRWPPHSPGELHELVDFIEQLNSRMRQLRDTSALPRSAVTLPDEFDQVVAEMLSVARVQADAAAAAGEGIVEVRVPRSEALAALARWAEPRMDLLTGLTRAGMVSPEWEGPVKLLVEVFEAVVGQLHER